MLNDLYHSLNPVAFSIAGLSVRWYGLAYVAGFACAALVIWLSARRFKLRINEDALLTVMLSVMIGIIVGGRLGYVLFYGFSYYAAHPLEILMLSNGGMSFHGGLIGALLSGIVSAHITGIPYLTLADLGCMGAPIGLFFGRIANFINGELWGKETDLPWAVVFGGSAGNAPRHPTQLYEALLEGLLLFLILYVFSRRRPPYPRGTFIGIFLLCYGAFRVLIEFVREPDAQLGYLWGGWLTMGMLLSALAIVCGMGFLCYAHVMKKPQRGLPEVRQEE